MINYRFVFILTIVIFMLLDNENNPKSETSNIAFEVSDLMYDDSESGNSFTFEAYKSALNDKILNDGDKIKQSQLLWVSAGRIQLQYTKDKNGMKKVFFKNKDGYHLFFQTLTKKQHDLLSQRANEQYQINVTQEQIVNLIFSEFSCQIRLFDEDGQKSLIKGQVSNFYDYPLRMDFKIPPKSKELSLFENDLNTTINDIKLQCKISASGKKVLSNSLTITNEVMEQLSIKEKLFGNSQKKTDEVFVTRNQLADISAEIYASMNIIEDYEIPETQFSANFIQELLQQMSTSFSSVSFEEALQRMSKYSTDFSADLKPDEIKREMSNIFTMKNINNKSHIIANEEVVNNLRDKNSKSNKVTAGASFMGFGLESSFATARSNEKASENMKKTATDQLRDMNQAEQDDVKWEIVGNRIVPKSLNVAKLINGNFKKKLVLTRIRRQYQEAAYKRNFTIYGHELGNEMKNSHEELKTSFDSLEKDILSLKNNISLMASKQVNNETLLIKKSLKELKDQIEKIQLMGKSFSHCILQFDFNCPQGYENSKILFDGEKDNKKIKFFFCCKKPTS